MRSLLLVPILALGACDDCQPKTVLGSVGERPLVDGIAAEEGGDVLVVWHLAGETERRFTILDPDGVVVVEHRETVKTVEDLVVTGGRGGWMIATSLDGRVRTALVGAEGVGPWTDRGEGVAPGLAWDGQWFLVDWVAAGPVVMIARGDRAPQVAGTLGSGTPALAASDGNAWLCWNEYTAMCAPIVDGVAAEPMDLPYGTVRGAAAARGEVAVDMTGELLVFDRTGVVRRGAVGRDATLAPTGTGWALVSWSGEVTGFPLRLDWTVEVLSADLVSQGATTFAAAEVLVGHHRDGALTALHTERDGSANVLVTTTSGFSVTLHQAEVHAAELTEEVCGQGL